jgi:hypothetical protein
MLVQLSHEQQLIENLISWLMQDGIDFQNKWDSVLRLLAEIAQVKL